MKPAVAWLPSLLSVAVHHGQRSVRRVDVRAAQHLGRHVEIVRHGFGHHAAWADEDARDADEAELRGFPEERELALRASVHWAA